MEVIPYSAAMAGLSSTLTLTTFTFSLYSTEISSRMGDSLRQGPHHSAQKSTITGLSAASTSVLKLASVTSFALLITLSLSSVGCAPVRRGNQRGSVRHRGPPHSPTLRP